ncbi:hypothetical protein J6590_079643 [Homalodisca vitripennis]|nr:hypothetical protein J6590_079643 [Homalodisca vitripennis]
MDSLTKRRKLGMLLYLHKLVNGVLDDSALLSMLDFAVPRPNSRSIALRNGKSHIWKKNKPQLQIETTIVASTPSAAGKHSVTTNKNFEAPGHYSSGVWLLFVLAHRPSEPLDLEAPGHYSPGVWLGFVLAHRPSEPLNLEAPGHYSLGVWLGFMLAHWASEPLLNTRNRATAEMWKRHGVYINGREHALTHTPAGGKKHLLRSIRACALSCTSLSATGRTVLNVQSCMETLFIG